MGSVLHRAERVDIFRSLASLILLLSACSSGPGFVQNDKYRRVGEHGAQKDFQECTDETNQRLARRAEKGAVIGGVIAGITGAGGGHMGSGALAGSAVGESTGESGPTEQKDPNDVRRDLIRKCLENRGYQLKD